MTLRPRLLPIVICAASGLLALKLVDLGAAAVAATQDTAAPSPDQPKPDASAVPSPPLTPARGGAAAPAVSPAAAPAADAANSAPPQEPAKKDPLQMSPEEVGELQQLSQRRIELDKRAADLSEREVLMAAAEKRVDEKIQKLAALQKQIEAEAKAKSEEDDKRVDSLAHMYEQMKPQEAARIFDQLDVPVVITMLTRIRELKAAPILAAMDPEKAKAVTMALTDAKNATPAPPTASAGAPTPAAQAQN